MADDVRCPVCSNLNPPEAQVCAFCGAPLRSPQSSEQPGSDEPDWLQDLRASDLPEQSDKGASEEGAEPFDQARNADADIPDWLARIRERNELEAHGDQGAEGQGQSAESVDWMNDLRNEGAAGPADDGDWLSRLNEEPAHPDETSQPSAEQPAGAEIPDWLRDLSGPATDGKEEQESPQATEDEYAWLNQAHQPVDEPSSSSDQEEYVGDDLRSFLSRLEGEGDEANPPDQAPRQSEAAESEPEWSLPENLSAEQASPDEAQAEQPLQAGEAAEDNFSSWMQSLEGESSEQSPEGPEAGNVPEIPSEQPEASPEPDWLHDFTAESYSTPVAGEPSDLPEWLKGEPDAGNELPQADSSGAEVPFQEVGPGEGLTAGVEGLVGWADSLEQPDSSETEPESSESVESGEPSLPETPGEEKLPDWLSELNEASLANDTEPSIPPLIEDEAAETPLTPEGDQPFSVELPEWLEEDQPEAEAGTSEPSAEESGELAKAELPDWVKDMRPIESIIPEQSGAPEADQHIEKAGPLAGLPGILPAEDLTTQYRKPPVYSMKLRVTERQRNQAALFDSILAEETQPLQIPRQRSQVQGTFLRVILAFILLVALALPQIPGIRLDPLVMPVIFPRDMQDMFYQMDQNLGSEAPVLLAVDYDPGLSGEMSLTAAAFVSQLEAKNARIVVVSTIPSGPALASQLLANAQRDNPGYDIARQTVSIGYLPGGATSLLAFARQPQLVTPVWQNSYLKDMQGLQAFGQIILLTDRAETGRVWVEQIQPAIGKVPLYIVASAQAAPLLEPYVASGQVAGMVRGVLGGAMYARLAGQANNPAIGYLSAYQIGIGLACVLVLVGGVISGSTVLLKRNHRDED